MIRSFGIMIEGMERDQFLKFRMALLPASGFQSAQYRMIEMCCTDMSNLVDKTVRSKINRETKVEDLLKDLYWRKGATELASKQKTLTLKIFEKKYDGAFIKLAKEYKEKNIWARFRAMDEASQKDPTLKEAMRQLDQHANVNWPLVHYRSAAKYLHKEPKEIAATGGTNWQKYLPPKNQQIIFFPDLWSSEELDDWGKSQDVDQFVS